MIYDFFISHVGEDTDIALQLYDKIQTLNHSCWTYEKNSKIGPPHITQSIDAIKDSEVMIVLITPNFIKRFHDTWMYHEIAFAVSKRRNILWVLYNTTYEELEQIQELQYLIGFQVCLQITDPTFEDHIPKILNNLGNVVSNPTEQIIQQVTPIVNKTNIISNKLVWIHRFIPLLVILICLIMGSILFYHLVIPSKDPLPVSSIFIPGGYMGDTKDISLNPSFIIPEDPASDVIKIYYSNGTTDGKRWAGVFWLYPDNNWGNIPEGYNLEGYDAITFRAKGEIGGERSIFKVGGVNGKYKDSLFPEIATETITFTKEWQKFEIPLTGKNLSNVFGGFCWVSNIDQNPYGATIYLDDINFIPKKSIWGPFGIWSLAIVLLSVFGIIVLYFYKRKIESDLINRGNK